MKRLSLSKKAAKRQLAQYVSGKVKKNGYKIDENQEILACAMGNIIMYDPIAAMGSFFSL